MNVQMSVLKVAGLLITGAAFCVGTAAAGPLPSYPTNSSVMSYADTRSTAATEETYITPTLNPALQRQVVNYAMKVAPGTVVIDTAQTYLYYVLGDGKAIRYGIGVGREGFTWSGSQYVTNKAEWPDWTPPQEMISRQPYLPRWMAGGAGNPLGARALYLGGTMYRIHGTNMPETIGKKVSSGCIRMLNEDVIDLYSRVDVGTKVIVLPNQAYATTVATSVAPARGVAHRTETRNASNL